MPTWTLWPSGLRRWLKVPFRKGLGSNPTGVNLRFGKLRARPLRYFRLLPGHSRAYLVHSLGVLLPKY